MRVIHTNTDLDTQRTLLENLESRLHHGDRLIRQMEAENKPVEHLVQHWLKLLKEYEAEYRSHQTAA